MLNSQPYLEPSFARDYGALANHLGYFLKARIAAIATKSFGWEYVQ
jgi:hypothetical protein